VNRSQILRERAIAYLGGSCKICGYDKWPCAFDFHHVDPLHKDFTISQHMTSWDRIKPELDKCELLCSNCHREVHDGLHPGFLVYDDEHGDGWFDDDDLDYDDDGEALHCESPHV